MSEDELTDLGIAGNLGGLCGGAVEGLLGKQGVLLGEGGFVVEAGDAADEVGELWTVGGVGAVGIGTDGVGWCGEPFVGDDGAVGECPVDACFDVVDL